MVIRSLVWSIGLVCCALVGAAAAAEAPAFEGLGRAPISGGDRVRARQRALDEAFGRVVESAASALLGPDVLTRRAADLRLKILPRAKSYLTTYRVLEEGEVEPGFFDVHVRAEVAADRLVRELAEPVRGDVKTPQAQARFGLCIADDGEPLPHLDAALRAILAARNLEPVPMTRCEDDELGRAVKAAGARGALVAELTASSPSPIRGTSLIGREGKLALRIVEPDGRRSADGHGEGAGYGATLAAASDELAIAALPQAGEPIEAALAALSGRARGGVTARLVGVRKLSQLATVRAALERLGGVEAVEARRFLPGLPGTVELQVRTSQPARVIADGLSRVASTYALRVREADGGVVVELADPLEPAGSP